MSTKLEEGSSDANGGIDDITARKFPIFRSSGLSAGDFVHLAAAAPAPDLTVPEPTVSPLSWPDSQMPDLNDAEEDVAPLSSHTIAAADVVDTTIPGTPFDSTVGIFYTKVFLEVLLKGNSFPGHVLFGRNKLVTN
ncbi:hypothetical protein BDQ12DRAFT_738523, partial [Crucibulum laeve]